MTRWLPRLVARIPATVHAKLLAAEEVAALQQRIGSYRQLRAAPDGHGVVVSVEDTGVGIAPEDQAAVFQEFRQVGPSAAKHEGTGLGLALCRRFVELHGGAIWVESAPGAGSTFAFRLPPRPPPPV